MPDADATRFVLVGTSHPGNVGAVARAIKVMGFGDLVLVAPRFADVLRRDEAIAFASGATDVLERARVVGTLVEALDGITFTCATAMTPRDFGPATYAPRALFGSLAASSQRVGFVFGSERHGLRNDDVYKCHACVSIPTTPAYGSLNLAQAVQLIAYEWRQANGGFGETAGQSRSSPPDAVALRADHADAVAIDRLVAHAERALIGLGFLDPAVPRKLVSRLHRLANRAMLTNDEVQILRGIARAIETRLGAAITAGQPGERESAD